MVFSGYEEAFGRVNVKVMVTLYRSGFFYFIWRFIEFAKYS